MWRLCRKTVFPRWHVNRQSPVENKNKNSENSKVTILLPSSHKEKYSGENFRKKQHAHKQGKGFWEDPQFHSCSFRSSILETAGWLGTAAVLCLNIHVKHFMGIYDHDKAQSHCIFPKNVFLMPLNVLKQESSSSRANISSNTFTSRPEKSKNNKVPSNTDALEDMRKLTSQYIGAVKNNTGLANIEKNSRKAFRCFQAAASLGSSQGFYNLGLCYELGKGTRVNLNRAAFCYRKAAMKGHGLAAFNLAVYFLKGVGGLPIDSAAAKVLLAAAADKGVPEAQTYIGIECLEEEKWSDAFTIFNNLSQKNEPNGHYYLGLCYENGWGTTKSERLAAELFSKSAAMGHQKAILKLGCYHEDGKGGCDSDYDFASALYQMLVDQGSEEGKVALAKLKLKQKALYLKGQPTEESHLKKSESKMHTHLKKENKMQSSASVPELTKKENVHKIHPLIPYPSYLDLSMSFFLFKTNVVNKTNFYIGEDNTKFSNSFLPCIESNTLDVVSTTT